MRSVHLSTTCPPNPSTLSTQPGSLDPAGGGQDVWKSGLALTPWEGFDPSDGSRFATAVKQLGDLLADGSWHGWSDHVTGIAATHGLKRKTVDTLLHTLVGRSQLERRGQYNRRFHRDHRMIRRVQL